MAEDFKGAFPYNKSSVRASGPERIGVYYIGHYSAKREFVADYVGSSGDIRTRLLQHLNQDDWRDVTHFGYRLCRSEQEALALEAAEIKRLKPKYNKLGKPSRRV